jgi:hypothetical protein
MGFLRSVPQTQAKPSLPLTSMPTTGAASTASHTTTLRRIALPFGTPEDGPGMHTVHALGNLTDQYFMQHLAQHGVEPYEEAIVLVRTLRV